MFRCRQPLRKVGCAGTVRHEEVQANKKGNLSFAFVNDCTKLDPVSDFDFDKQKAAGENVKEISTIIKNPNMALFFEDRMSELYPNNEGEKQDEE